MLKLKANQPLSPPIEPSPQISSSSTPSSTSPPYCWQGGTPTTAHRLSFSPSTFPWAINPSALSSHLNTELYYRSACHPSDRVFKWDAFDPRPPGASLPDFKPGLNNTPVNTFTRRKIAAAFSYPVNFGQVKYQLEIAIDEKEEMEDEEEEEGEVLEERQFAFPRIPLEEYRYPARDVESSPTPHGLWGARVGDGGYCLSPAQPCANCRYSWPLDLEELDERLKKIIAGRRGKKKREGKKKKKGRADKDEEEEGGRLTESEEERTTGEERDGENVTKSEDAEGKGDGEMATKSKRKSREEERDRESTKKTKGINLERERKQEENAWKNEERAEQRMRREIRRENQELG